MKKAVLAFIGCWIITSFAVAADLPRKGGELAFKVPGNQMKLLSAYKGKVIAVEFIYTTCPHCQAAAKVMTKLQQEYGPRGFQAIDVAFNENADLKVESFIKDFQVGFPVGWSDREQVIDYLQLGNQYFVVPQMVIIDRKGMVRFQTPANGNDQHANDLKEETLRQRIEQLLGETTARKTSHSKTNKTVASSKS